MAFALIIGIVERSIPLDFAIPGVKLGLGNVVILSALYLFTVPEAFALTLLKTFMVAMFTGSFPSFMYSLSGALLSFAAMAISLKLMRDKVTPIGISVVGAIFHNLGQIIAVSVVMGTFLFVSYLPILLVSGVITGILVGIAVKYTLRLVKNVYAGGIRDAG